MSKGYSLLELLIVVAIIVVFSGLSLPYFHTATSDRQLDQEVKKFIDYVELAKQKAAASSVSDVINDVQCVKYRGYEIVFDSTTVYRVRACCSNSAFPNNICSYLKDKEIYTLPSGFTMSFSANINPPSVIHFPVLQLGTLLTSDATITIKSAAISKCVSVTINRVGVVNEGNKVSC